MKRKKIRKSIKILLIIFIIIFVGVFFYNRKKLSNNKSNPVSIKQNEYDKLGYSKKEQEYIKKLSLNNQNKIKNIHYINIKNYYNIKNFNVDNYNRYEDYKNRHKDYSYQKIVTMVNIKNDLTPYTNTNEVKDPNDILVLVNKYNYLPLGYKPNNLTYVDGAYGNKVPMQKIIVNDFIELQKKAKEESMNLMPTTAFRDYNFQKNLYTKYSQKNGTKMADTYSARPGFSEHQTGLAIDLKNTNLKNIRLTEDNYNWLYNNAYKYGFIIRYEKGKENITGYQFENWHIRYVGKKHAKIIYDNNLTLEEYIDLYINNY